MGCLKKCFFDRTAFLEKVVNELPEKYVNKIPKGVMLRLFNEVCEDCEYNKEEMPPEELVDEVVSEMIFAIDSVNAENKRYWSKWYGDDKMNRRMNKDYDGHFNK